MPVMTPEQELATREALRLQSEHLARYAASIEIELKPLSDGHYRRTLAQRAHTARDMAAVMFRAATWSPAPTCAQCLAAMTAPRQP